MPKVPANGIKIHYQHVGEGPDVVMLHGLTGNLAVWHLKIVGMLQKEFHIITYDLRGHGYSDMPPTGYTTKVMAADLKGVLDGLEIDRAYLVGHSFGADVALHFALLHPERVDKVVAIEAGLAAMIRSRKREDWEGWRNWRETLAAFGLHVPREHWYDPVYMLKLSLKVPKIFGPATGRPRKAEPLLNMLHKTTVIEDYEEVDGFTLDRVEEIRTPTLLVYGESSAFLVTYRYLSEHLPDTRSVMLPRSNFSHFGPLEHPELLAQHIKGFFQEQAATLPTQSESIAGKGEPPQ